MLWTKIATRELRALLREGSTHVLAAVSVVLIAVSVFAPLPGFRANEDWKRTSSEKVREQWLTQGSRHPHAAAHYGIVAFRPLPATALLDPGVSEFIGQAQPLETHERHFAIHPQVEEATSARRMAGLSPSVLALALIPLLVILVGYNAISGERESGTLAQLMATGIGPRQILGGKAAALMRIAAVILVVKASLEAVAVWQLGASGDWARYTGLQVLHAVYAAVWVLLVLGVSARVRSSSKTLAVLLALWTASTFVAPRIAGSIGRLVVREPSVEEFRAAIQHDIATKEDGTPWVEQWSKQLIEDTLKSYNVSRIEDLPVGYAGIMLKGSDAHYEEVFEKHFQQLFELHRTQERWHLALSGLGPTMAARAVSQGVAGTDLAHAEDFSNAAERYRRTFVESTNDAIQKGTKGTGWDLRVSRAYWESIPAFHYQTPDAMWAVQQHLWELGVLGAWLGLAAVFCVLSAKRMAETVR